ncbi:hypothetical protein M406DRAFT_335266 [Cryphonectria parasitica EP155]|uniref:Uncharacterized protein n=1 Tax=Cryphonectria parasitica (strain ATCC 38755 / EP155) TaxID=660469 RepID=A0A9P5CJT4_CRYP1|nr:uncharacterized protein M406DRAFT_335266 [Cryphonectria parasitica EP155]KAF3760055.1 hypothetical protein M406DRAFT_335266 [Cryphonectria parasitica EP155]
MASASDDTSTMSGYQRLLQQPELSPVVVSKPTVMAPGRENPYPLIVHVPKSECRKTEFEVGENIMVSGILSLHCFCNGEQQASARRFGLRCPKIAFVGELCYFCFGSLTMPEDVTEGSYFFSILCQFFQPFKLLKNGRSSGGEGLTGRVRSPVFITRQVAPGGVLGVGPDILRLFIENPVDDNEENKAPALPLSTHA